MSFTNINKKTDPKTDFWELNPQLQYLAPFNKLKKLKNSSHYMWAIFFMSDPDEDINKFYRYDLAKRQENINNLYPNLDWNNEVFQECLEAYPFECLNSIQRSLKDEKDSLRQRAKMIKDTPYTLDYTDLETGKLIKGTATQLDSMRTKTEKIYDQLEKALNKFTKQKEEEVRVRGGRRESASERGLVAWLLILICVL